MVMIFIVGWNWSGTLFMAVTERYLAWQMAQTEGSDTVNLDRGGWDVAEVGIFYFGERRKQSMRRRSRYNCARRQRSSYLTKVCADNDGQQRTNRWQRISKRTITTLKTSEGIREKRLYRELRSEQAWGRRPTSFRRGGDDYA